MFEWEKGSKIRAGDVVGGRAGFYAETLKTAFELEQRFTLYKLVHGWQFINVNNSIAMRWIHLKAFYEFQYGLLCDARKSTFRRYSYF